jgi:predicted metalloprotease
MRDEDLPESSNIEDRRGEGGGFGGGGGMPGGFPMGRGGGLGIGAVVVLGLLGWALGIDPRLLIGGAEMLTRGQQPQVNMPQQPQGQRQSGTPKDESGRFVSRVLGATEAVWKDVFINDYKRAYQTPTLILFNGQTSAQCGGRAEAAMGPFYCPADRKVYLDTSFFAQIETRFRGCEGRACRFSQAYVSAHEVGHHVQNLVGVLDSANRGQQAAGGKSPEANRIQVRVELQADCFAGLWAKRENEALIRQGRPAFIEQGDVDAALKTAAAIGDDTLQRRSSGRVVPDSFTHGTSEQRQRWFNMGYQQGTVGACNTHTAQQL